MLDGEAKINNYLEVGNGILMKCAAHSPVLLEFELIER
jgi:hypothetical protein